MATPEPQPNAKPEPESDPLPKILILKPPPVYGIFESEFCRHFHAVKPYERTPLSPHLDLHHFLSSGAAADITAMLVTGTGPPITADDVLCHLPSLRCIVTTSAGVDYIDLDECRRRGIAVANAGDVYSEDCADMVVALLIDVLRKVSAGDRYVRNADWRVKGAFPLGNRLRGKRVGVVGFGHIGSKVALRLESFGCTISYTSRQKRSSIPYPFYADILQLATNNDILVICCALTDQTRHMINKQVLTALGHNGILINIARGAVVDETELVRFLVEGQIAGAGLDVFENEPTVPKELFGLNNVVLSPHRAVFTEESFRDVYEHVKANFLAFFSNRPLLSRIENEG